MAISAQDVKRLREATGVGMMDCKKALEETAGDFDKAVELLRIKGAKDVGKRAGRATANGIVAARDGSSRALLDAALSSPSRRGVLVDAEGRLAGTVTLAQVAEAIEREAG